MDRIEINIVTNSGYRPTEVVADLRNAVESIYFPMKAVAYWDVRSQDHRCPQALLGKGCPHVLPPDDSRYVPYEKTVEWDLDGVVDVYFPHGQVHVYVG